MERRTFLTAAVGAGMASSVSGCASVARVAAEEADVSRNLRDTSVYVPGYITETARARGGPVTAHPRLARALSAQDGPARLLTRIGFDGTVTQAVLPVMAHQVAVSPNRRIGILCGFEARDQVAFDPVTLDMVAKSPAFAEGWRGGGHAVFLDQGRTALVSERAPRFSAAGSSLADHHGRITIRDSDTLKVRGSYSTHGIDPHDIRLIEDDRYLVIANYGSLPDPDGFLPVPRRVAEASVTVIEVASGRLVEKWVTGRADAELRHLAAGGRDRIFAIQARLGTEADEAQAMRGHSAVYSADITSEPGITYLSAQTLKIAKGQRPKPMGTAVHTADMRHGLSISYDPQHDQAIATYPSSHRVMVFDGASGAVLHDVDTTASGLRYPCGVTLLPDGLHYAVTGYWENLFVYRRGSHQLVRELCLYPVFFGHSHITAV
ncbi:DUF1513 domain-containing protein [Pseudotabrizicola alkalilacus]|uniref:DUF1513 domain-containing protein n=1 Tax=Pseudotabrizicola alkalilacus TaxID=2305252 RepID=A0A411Z3S2_9RHOB|nr:DUF1513 domain-containing protein [Pseudotabrizicola alkalilacus]RGP37711.1 DUF1513 domain-containing protein [Pseudotabrizicola alkalilacus]